MLSSICFMPASLRPQSLPPGSPIIASYFGGSTVVMCIRAGLYHTKNGLLVFFGSLRSRKSMTLAEISSSTVLDRSSVSGPSSLHVMFLGVIAEMVLAELAGVVALVEQKLCYRRGARPQPGRAAGQLRRNHSRAQRMHAGEEGVAPGGAALLGIISHEERAIVSDAVDVRRLANHQATMVDARLHNADVVAHDEDDVGLAGRRLRERGQAERR